MTYKDKASYDLYTYKHTCGYQCVYMYMYICVYVYVFVCVSVCIYMHTCVYVDTNVRVMSQHAQIHLCERVCACVMQTHIHITKCVYSHNAEMFFIPRIYAICVYIYM